MTIEHPLLVGLKDWHTDEGIRYVVFLYKACAYSGQLRSSDEGQVLWVNRQDLSQMDLAYDMLALLRVFDEPDLSEYFYGDKIAGEWGNKKFY